MVPTLRGVPRRVRRRLVVPFAKNAAVRTVLRWMTRPLVAWPMYVVAILGWHAPAMYDAALRNETLHILEHLVFSVTAFLFWWNVIDPIPLRPNLVYLARLPYLFVTTVPNFSLGAFLVFSPDPWYEAYQGRDLALGLSPLADQQLGGLVMWVPGSLALLLALVIVLFVVLVKEEQHQRQREAQAATAA